MIYLLKCRFFKYNQFVVYELDLATPKNRYYSYNDYFLLLDINGGILTDMENFYSEAMYEDVCTILKGELKCLYKSDNIDEMIKEYGGKEGFLKEFDH